MSNTTDKYAPLRAAREKLRAELSAIVDRAAGNGVPDIIIADQLLYVGMTTMLNFVEWGADPLDLEIFVTMPSAVFHKHYLDPDLPRTRPEIHPASGDKVSPMTEIAAVEVATRQAREEMLAVARSFVGTLFPRELCGPVIDIACELGPRALSAQAGEWKEMVKEIMRRFEHGELRTDAELLEQVANRRLISGMRPAR